MSDTILREGDVVRYEPTSTWCYDGYAIARLRLGGLVLLDTYWGGTSPTAVIPRTFEVLFNLADYDLREQRQWVEYDPADREFIPAHAGLRPMFLVRKGAAPSHAQRVSNAREALEEAEAKHREAGRAVEWRRRQLGDLLTAGGDPA